MFEEKRNHQRKSQKAEVIVNILSDSKDPTHNNDHYECSSKDISKNGVKLYGNQSFIKGSRLKLEASHRKDEDLMSLIGYVKWTTVTTENEHLTGVEFSETNSPDIGIWKGMF